MLRNTRLVMTRTLANISGRTETTRILIDDVTFYIGGYFVFEMEKTAYRKIVSQNDIEINLGIEFRDQFTQIKLN